MNLVEQLLKADKEKAESLETKEIKSKRLAKILGEKKPINIIIQEIPHKRINYIMGMIYDKKGKVDREKTIEANTIAVVDGVIDPNLKDEKLAEHFGCVTPKELAEKLFGNEIGTIADKIVNLSGLTDDEEMELEDEIKN